MLAGVDIAALIVAFGVLVVSGVAAAAAVVQARAAATSREEAERALVDTRAARDEAQELARVATAAFVRQAEAQEKSNALKEQEMKPADWTPRHVSGDLHQLVNTSGRTIVVSSYDIEPDGTEDRVQLGGNPDGIYQYGDVVEYMVIRVFGENARKLILTWRYEDDPIEVANRFILTL